MNTSFFRRVWVTFSVYVVGIYASVLNKLRIIGDKHIPKTGGVLLASNHISGYETVFLPWAVIRRHPLQMVWAPAKEELFRNPFLSWLFKSWGAFPVKRRRDMRAGKTLNNLLSTEKVMLFPEGTRSKDGTLGQGNRGVGKVIYETRPQVVPTALSGLNKWKFPGIRQEAKIIFGAPIDFTDLFELEDCKETHLKIVSRVMSAIQDLLKP